MSFDATHPIDLPELPAAKLDHNRFNKLLLQARTEIAELKGYTLALPNPMLLLSPIIIREAIASSEVENIHTTAAEVLQEQLFSENEQKDPNREVLHYREALLRGNEELKKIPVSSRLIKLICKKLLPEGDGNFRRNQNKIINDQTGETLFTPPPANEINRLMSNWEKYVNDTGESEDPLIKCIISHYQFEAIHPFNNGNGRTGRILMVLYLVQTDLLHIPNLFISGYINRHKSDYYNLLQNISKRGNWDEFIEFMLVGFYEQAKETTKTFFKVKTLFDRVKKEISEVLPDIYSAELVEAIFNNPVISPLKLAEALKKHRTTTSRYLHKLRDNGLLVDAKVGRYHLFANLPLVEILKGN